MAGAGARFQLNIGQETRGETSLQQPAVWPWMWACPQIVGPARLRA